MFLMKLNLFGKFSNFNDLSSAAKSAAILLIDSFLGLLIFNLIFVSFLPALFDEITSRFILLFINPNANIAIKATETIE